ncbi:Maleamate amidohydrolase [Roseivivax jejudonensis]|uniref:Maleamate amidohydrolase n=1 Tax=Roseivivax jejudonensis TaxID=1529041 RepID=A0A1X7A1L9_9RHOB|nr:isochorismatase family protein [Roseivivax jejudonensis]SLN66041.1 Maleamate amidohydrolase [Roseivivax jejudonensis]
MTEPASTDGFGNDMGWGARPLLLVIDVTRAFTEADRPLGSDGTALVSAVNRLVGAARSGGVPIMFTRVAYDRPDLSDAGLWARKIGTLGDLVDGGAGVEMDPRLDCTPTDPVLTKKYASCFFGTDLASRLTSAGIDTLVVAGLSTSGCVRATVVDAIQLGFRPIVVEDAVADRWQDAHRQSLADMAAKYADLTSVDAAVERLAS